MTHEELVELLKVWPEPDVCRYLATEVRRARQAVGESQREFAERAGVPLRTYKRFESHGQAHLETFIRVLRNGRTQYLFMLFPQKEVLIPKRRSIRNALM